MSNRRPWSDEADALRSSVKDDAFKYHLAQDAENKNDLECATEDIIFSELAVAEKGNVDGNVDGKGNVTSEENQHIVAEVFYHFLHRSWQKKALTVLTFLLSALVYADLFMRGGYIDRAILWFLDTSHPNGWDGILAFAGAFAALSVVGIPPSLMTIGTGYVFRLRFGLRAGVPAALAVCFCGSIVGAVVAFYRSKYLMRVAVKIFVRRYSFVRAVDAGLKRKAFRVMVVLRLCTVVPDAALNSMCGATGVSLGAFVAGMVGALPSQLVLVVLGATIEDLHSQDGTHNFTGSAAFWFSAAVGWLVLVITLFIYREGMKEMIQRD